jgi:hypothetical protein
MFEGLLHLKGALQSMTSTSGCPVLTEQIRKGLNEAHDRLVQLGDAIGAQAWEKGQDFHMQGILEAMIDDFESRWGDGTDINKYTLGTNNTNKGQPCGYTRGQVLCFTLDPRMVTLPQVPEDQEEAVCRVLEIRCKELMRDDETERKWSAHVDEPTRPPQSPHTSDNSHTTNLLRWNKPSKMVLPPHLTPAQNVLDVANLDKEVSPTDTNFLSHLWYTYLGHLFVYVSVAHTVVPRSDPYFCLHRRSVNT